MNLRRQFICSTTLGFVALLLSACAALPPERPATETLEVSGRFVAKAGKESSPGRFFLRNDAQGLLLELSTPFGQTQARFTQQAGRSSAWVATPTPREVQGSSLEALSEQLLGWPVPVAKLTQWLLALPKIGSDARMRASGLATTATTLAEQRAGAGELRLISDGHWTLEVQDWFGLEQARQPRLLQLRNRSTDSPVVELRLIVETWDAAP